MNYSIYSLNQGFYEVEAGEGCLSRKKSKMQTNFFYSSPFMSLSAIEVLLARFQCTVIDTKMMFDIEENIIFNHVSTTERAEIR